MKTLFLAFRVEWSNKSQFFIHASIITLVLYLTMQYYGAYYGAVKESLKDTPLSLSAQISKQIDLNDISNIQNLFGFQSFLISADESIDTKDNLYQFATFDGEFAYDIQLEGRTFSDDEINDALPVVIIPYSYRTLTGKDIGDTIQIGDSQYIVIGVVGEVLNGYFFVPYTTLFRYFTPNNIQIVFDHELLSDGQVQTVFEQTRQILGEVNEQWNIRRDFASLFNSRKTESILYFSLGIMSLIFVFSYILKKRQFRMSVYSLHGCSSLRSVLLTTLGSWGVFNIGFCGAYLLGKAMNRAVFSTFFSYDSFLLETSDILFFYASTALLYLIIISAYLIKFRKITAIGVYRRSE